MTLVTFLSVIYYLDKHVMITNDDEFNYIGQKVTFRRLVANKILMSFPYNNSKTGFELIIGRQK